MIRGLKHRWCRSNGTNAYERRAASGLKHARGETLYARWAPDDDLKKILFDVNGGEGRWDGR